MKRTFARSWPYLPYVLFSVLLIYARNPFIDEAWYTYPAVVFQRGGSVLDFSWCQLARPHRYLFEATSITLAAWYRIGNVSIVWGRALMVVAGLLFLFVLHRCLVLTQVPTRTRNFASVITGLNYFFLYATSQIRPEALALLTSGLAVYAYLSWQQNRTSVLKIILAHLFVIVAILFHWQAVFIGLGIWSSMLLLDRKELKTRHVVSVLLLYCSFAIAYSVHIYPFRDFLAELQLQLSGNASGHRGGMFALVWSYLQTQHVLKLIVALGLAGLIGVGGFRYLATTAKDPGKVALFVFGFCGYLSWLLTGTALDDYHAVWLSFALMLMVVSAIDDLGSTRFKTKLFGVGLIVLPVFLALYGCLYALRTAYENPLTNIYERDLKTFDSQFGLKETTVSGSREAMWYFGFDWPVGVIPEYYVVANINPIENLSVCGADFTLVKKGLEFGLYHRLSDRVAN